MNTRHFTGSHKTMVRVSGALLMAIATGGCVSTPAERSPEGSPLIGTWRLVSFEGEVQGSTDKVYSMGRAPVGYLSFIPGGRMAVVITAEGRKAGASEQERAALYSSLIAYAGGFRIEGDKWVVSVEASANPAWVGTEQPRSFKVTGSSLQEVTPWFPRPDKSVIRFVNTWERVN